MYIRKRKNIKLSSRFVVHFFCKFTQNYSAELPLKCVYLLRFFLTREDKQYAASDWTYRLVLRKENEPTGKSIG